MKYEKINLLTEHLQKINHQIIDLKYEMITKKQFLKNIEKVLNIAKEQGAIKSSNKGEYNRRNFLVGCNGRCPTDNGKKHACFSNLKQCYRTRL